MAMPLTGAFRGTPASISAKASATGSGHAGTAITAHNFGDGTDSIGKVGFFWQYGLKSPLGQCAMADFTPTGLPKALDFTDRIARHVVVVEEAFLGLFFHRINHLGIGKWRQSSYIQSLGRAAGKNTAAVDTR